jgi:hypothetical protein
MNALHRWIASHTKVSGRLSRTFYALCTIRSYADRLNRCVAVENRLMESATGKRPPPTPEECRQLAMKLAGVITGELK